MTKKEIVADLVNPRKIAKKYITLYAVGTFIYGIALGILVSFQLNFIFNNAIIVYSVFGVLLVIGMLIVGPSFSKIMRNYEIREKKAGKAA